MSFFTDMIYLRSNLNESYYSDHHQVQYDENHVKSLFAPMREDALNKFESFSRRP